MRNIVFANIDYEPVNGRGGHMTDEGMQLQRGLEHAGWKLVGAGFDDGCKDVKELISRHKPECIFVQDKRDWDPSHGGSFRKDIGFENIGYLASRGDIFKVVVVKDAGTCIDYHKQFCSEVNADAVVIYYHKQSVLKLSPWLSSYRLIRTYHSIDKNAIAAVGFTESRMRGVVSGARSSVYPLRELVFRWHKRLGIEAIAHPGYGNNGSVVSKYLTEISKYKVHVATASRYGFALRKIIESVAVGCIPLTDLPAYDVLPEINDALYRVGAQQTMPSMMKTIKNAASQWDPQKQSMYAKKACEFYDWRALGVRLSDSILRERSLKNDFVQEK